MIFEDWLDTTREKEGKVKDKAIFSLGQLDGWRHLPRISEIKEEELEWRG